MELLQNISNELILFVLILIQAIQYYRLEKRVKGLEDVKANKA